MLKCMKKVSRNLSIFLSVVLFFSCLSAAIPLIVSAGETEITFNTLAAGNYYQEGMPLFDGNPDHLDVYIDTYLDWVGLEGACLYATGLRDSYQLQNEDDGRKGWILPGGLSAADNDMGIGEASSGTATEFPVGIGQGQSWDKELMKKIGDAMGDEKMSNLIGKWSVDRNNHNGKDYSGSGSYLKPKTIAFTAISDLRVNPLSGRLDESYGEDPILAASMIDDTAKGFIGETSDPDDPKNGFYTRGVIATKHPSNYAAEWFRASGDFYQSARSIFEYGIQSIIKPLKNGALAGGMTSFGRTNGIANEISPYNILLNSIAKYGYYSSPDFNAENHLYTANEFGNGYDTQYVPDRAHALALMSLANVESVRASGTDKTDVMALYNLVKSGAYGITEADVRRSAKPLLTQMVRAGLFDEIDENGFSKFNPYNDQFKDYIQANSGTLSDYTNTEHQSVALQAARESCVLLKNDNSALPIPAGSSVAIAGVQGDARFKTSKAISTTPTLTGSGQTPLYAILQRYDAADRTSKVSYSSGVPRVAIKADNGMYLTVSGTGTTATITASFNPDTIDGEGYYPYREGGIQSGAINFTDAQLFDVYNWGQGAYSIKSVSTGEWLYVANTISTALSTRPVAVNLTSADWSSMTATKSTLPARLRFNVNNDGTITFVGSSFSAETTYWTSGIFVDIDGTGKLVNAAAKTSANNTPTSTQKFTFETQRSAETEINAQVNSKDYAMIFIGTPPTNCAGEGADRSTLLLSDNDYALVHSAAAAYKAQGKKTVVVLKASAPFVMEEIQNDSNVDAILYQPYAGQYDGQALADVLYGDYAPTGRLVESWYKSDSILPDISKYSIPDGNTNTLSNIDPRFKKDMTNANAYDLGLTYMYCNDTNVTYPFGYGLSYSQFEYSNFTVPAAAGDSQPFTVSVDVKNKGAVATDEVVQLYYKKVNSAYGDAAPNKKLVSFEKVKFSAGEEKTVTLTVDPSDMSIWDVNRGDYIVESGAYSLMVGTSSRDIKSTKNINISGEQVQQVEADNTINVFDHSYAAKDVVYKEVSKLHTAQSLKAQKIVDGYYAVMSKKNGAWTAIPNAYITNAYEVTARVATNNSSGGTISLYLDSISSGDPIATIDVPVTSSVTVDADGIGMTANELGYEDVTVDLDNTSITGSHDIYIVFNAPDLRIDSLNFTLDSSGSSSSATLNAPEFVNSTSQFNVALGLAAVENISAQDISVSYDNNHFDFVGAESARADTVLLETANDVTNGAIRFIMASTGVENAITGDADVLNLTFNPKTTGPGVIAVTNADVSDTQGTVTKIANTNIEITVVDKTLLAEKIAAAQSKATSAVPGTEPGQYPAAAIAALQTAVDAATGVLNDEDSTDIEITQAVSDLSAAIAVFDAARIVEAEADKTELISAMVAAQALYDAAVEGLSAGQYPAGTKDRLNTAINAAKEVRDNSGVSSAEVSQATEDLNAAADTFKALKITASTGDINNSGAIDIGDLGIVASHYGISSGDSDWAAIKAADINGDGTIGIYELAFIAIKLIVN
jgi:beta-glucosidase